jgi:hypothetical protein
MTFTNDLGQSQPLNVPQNWFLGIIISAGPSALNAHLKHGDGFAEVTFSPALHLSSTGQNHEASNVECFAERATTTAGQQCLTSSGNPCGAARRLRPRISTMTARANVRPGSLPPSRVGRRDRPSDADLRAPPAAPKNWSANSASI